MGTLRLLLAIIVILYHSRRLEPWPHLPFLPIPGAGEAVWIFFVMSGFYMSLILNEKYQNRDTLIFYANRWLRIWPMYMASLLLVAFLVWKTGVLCAVQCIELGYLGQLLQALPDGWVAAIAAANLFLFGLDLQWMIGFNEQGGFYAPFPTPQNNAAIFTLNSPAWTIGVELVFYLIAPFLVRSVWKLGAVLVASIGLHLYYGPADTFHVFFWPPAFYLFISLGALTYHAARRWPWLAGTRKGQIAAFIWCFVWLQVAHAIANPTLNHQLGLHSYLTVLAVLPLMPVLLRLTARSRFDHLMGDVSYPVFILHGPIFIYLLWSEPVPAGPQLSLLILIASLLAGAIGYLIVQRPVSKWRERWIDTRLHP